MSPSTPLADLTLSVIIAAYDIEHYIATCIDSVLDNQRRDYEVVIVDDGSTDDTGHIIDRYNNDDRVRIIHQKNGGLGDARNTGLDMARGKFVCFVDGDDWLDSHAVDKWLETIDARPKTEVFVFDYYDVDDDKFVRQVCGPAFWECRNAAWNKIFARSLIGNERFDTDIIFEDLAQIRPWVARATRIERIDAAPYRYRNSRSGSIMTSSDSVRFFDLLIAASRCASRIEAAFVNDSETLEHKLGEDWKQRLYTVDVFVPALVGWPRKLASARKRRDFAAKFFAELPDDMLDKRRLARDFSYKIAVAAACYEHGAFVSGDWLLHRLGRVKRRFLKE